MLSFLQVTKKRDGHNEWRIRKWTRAVLTAFICSGSLNSASRLSYGFLQLNLLQKKRTAGPKPMHAIHKPKQFSSGWKGGMKSNMCCSQQKEKFFKMWNIGFLPCIAYFNPTSWDIFIKEEPKFPIFFRSIIVLLSPLWHTKKIVLGGIERDQNLLWTQQEKSSRKSPKKYY